MKWAAWTIRCSCYMDYKMGKSIEACKPGRNLLHQTKSSMIRLK